MLCRKRDNEIAVIGDKGVGDADDPAVTVVRSRRKGALDIDITTARCGNDGSTKRPRCYSGRTQVSSANGAVSGLNKSAI
jgi:hypothetical protein